MYKYNYFQSSISGFLIAVVTATAIGSFLPLNSVLAREFESQRQYDRREYDRRYYQRAEIPQGTRIPVAFKKEKILAAPNETFPVTLTVDANIRDRNRELLIPFGSKIEGRIEPSRNGSRFVAERLILEGDNREYDIDATSRTVSRRETIKQGASARDILTGAAAGAGAAAIISGVTGRRGVAALEVLAGAATGALAGWALPEAGVIGGGKKEVIVIYPDRDLELTFERDLFLR